MFSAPSLPVQSQCNHEAQGEAGDGHSRLHLRRHPAPSARPQHGPPPPPAPPRPGPGRGSQGPWQSQEQQ